MKGLQSSGFAQVFNFVNVLVASVVPSSRLSLGILVCEARSQGLDDRHGCEVLRCDEFDPLPAAPDQPIYILLLPLSSLAVRVRRPQQTYHCRSFSSSIMLYNSGSADRRFAKASGKTPSMLPCVPVVRGHLINAGAEFYVQAAMLRSQPSSRSEILMPACRGDAKSRDFVRSTLWCHFFLLLSL